MTELQEESTTSLFGQTTAGDQHALPDDQTVANVQASDFLRRVRWLLSAMDPPSIQGVVELKRRWIADCEGVLRSLSDEGLLDPEQLSMALAAMSDAARRTAEALAAQVAHRDRLQAAAEENRRAHLTTRTAHDLRGQLDNLVAHLGWLSRPGIRPLVSDLLRVRFVQATSALDGGKSLEVVLEDVLEWTRRYVGIVQELPLAQPDSIERSAISRQEPRTAAGESPEPHLLAAAQSLAALQIVAIPTQAAAAAPPLAGADVLQVLRQKIEDRVPLTVTSRLLTSVATHAEEGVEREFVRRAALALLLCGSCRPAGAAAPFLRRLDAITDAEQAGAWLLDLARLDTIDLAGLTVVHFAALEHDFVPEVAWVAHQLGQGPSWARRRWLGELASVCEARVDGIGRVLASLCKARNLDGRLRDELESYATLDDEGAHTAPRNPAAGVDSLVCEFVEAVRDRRRHSSRVGEARVRTQLLRVAAEKGLEVPEGAQRIKVPLLVQNSGKRGAGAIEVEVSVSNGSGWVVPDRATLFCAWLTRSGPREGPEAILELPLIRRVTDEDEVPGDADPLTLHVRTWWAGCPEPEPEPVAISLRLAAGRNVARQRMHIRGADGSPVDLTDEEVLDASPRTVQKCFKQLRDDLRAAKPVRALVFGRRRRGKSSISRSLARDPEIRAAQFAIQESTWNRAPARSAREVLEELAILIRGALRDRGGEVEEFRPRDGLGDSQFAAYFDQWLREACGRVREPLRVLLLIDEFQRCLSKLDPADRNTVQGALRSLIDNNFRNVTFSFVLTGLQIVKSLAQLADFKNVVREWEIRDFAQDEAVEYSRRAFPDGFDVDQRTRRRLAKLAGGNPYMLNLLCNALLQRLQEEGRTYCTLSDVEDLVEGIQEDAAGVQPFLLYMLREDEDDHARTLPQLTVLRAVATLLRSYSDFDALVRRTDVIEWLGRQNVPVDSEQIVTDHLHVLCDLGILERGPEPESYRLPGEWVCRWLAQLDSELLPISGSADRNLVLNRFRLQERLATGAQARGLWRARNVEHGGHDLVLKLYDASPDARERARREVLLLSQVRSEYVVRCHGHDLDEQHGNVVLLDWIDGRTLRVVLDSSDQLDRMLSGDQDLCLRLLQRITEGVAAIHKAGVVHGDLTSKNVLLVLRGGEFDPRIIDFGSAGPDDGAPVPATERPPGHAAAPEATRTRRADVYSLAVLFLEVLAAYHSEDDAVTPFQALADARTKGLVGSSLAALICEMMVRDDPSSRPAAEDVLARLRRLDEDATWLELLGAGDQLLHEGKHPEALEQFRRAISAAPPSDRHLERFQELVSYAIMCLDYGNITSMEGGMRWLIDATLDTADRQPQRSLDWRGFIRQLQKSTRFATAVDESRWWEHSSEPRPRESDLYFLLSELRKRGGQPQTGEIISAICAEVAAATGDAFAEELFDLGVQCRETNRQDLALFAVRCATYALERADQQHPLTLVDTWLRRARRLGLENRPEYQGVLSRMREERKRTGYKLALPPDCEAQDATAVGRGEAGHLEVARIEAFAQRVLQAYPFVYTVRRVRKDGALEGRVKKPSLLPLDNIGRHRQNGIPDTRIIPMALDGSFCAEHVPLRMNIVLSEGTTEGTREAAFERMRQNLVLFPGGVA